jgi:CxxC motif-containing protein (DUF1111 family)
MCNKPNILSDDQYDNRLSGGLATTFDETSQAFTHGIDGLNGRDGFVHELGDKAFEQTFVSAPAPVFGGLGYIYNNVSCISCHHNDGKGTPTAGLQNSSLLIRVSIPGTDGHGAPLSVPGYGFQIQDKALIGITPEATVNIDYTDVPVTYPDGITINLHKPTYALFNPYYSLPASYYISPRLAPPVFGIGLLDNIPENTLLSFADEKDADGDGISGRPNYIFDTALNIQRIGRFGLKANTISLQNQVALAYQQDIGVTNYLFPDENSKTQSQDKQGNVTAIELPDSTLNAVIFYVKTLSVPARRDVNDATNEKGEVIFTQLNCSGCHKPTIYTGYVTDVPSLSNQRIHPYTDLLLHDMGDGLADGRPDFIATGNEWRTAPLWGLGILQKVQGVAYYLHDGHARSVEEAILWHGGEAEKSKVAFMNLSKTDRDALLSFLKLL